MEITAGELFDKYAQQYADKYMDVSLYGAGLDMLCDRLQGNAVLDIACGPGNIAGYLLRKQSGLNIQGIDIAPNMIDLARQYVPGADFMVMDGRDILRLGKRYDGIICAFVLPYLNKTDTLQLLADAADILNNNGLLYLSFMNGSNESSAYQSSSSGDKLFVHYHEEGYITEALALHGMDIIHMNHLDAPANAKHKTDDVVIVARKG